jgi:hypothetical protein
MATLLSVTLLCVTFAFLFQSASPFCWAGVNKKGDCPPRNGVLSSFPTRLHGPLYILPIDTPLRAFNRYDH